MSDENCIAVFIIILAFWYAADLCALLSSAARRLILTANFVTSATTLNLSMVFNR